MYLQCLAHYLAGRHSNYLWKAWTKLVNPISISPIIKTTYSKCILVRSVDPPVVPAVLHKQNLQYFSVLLLPRCLSVVAKRTNKVRRGDLYSSNSQFSSPHFGNSYSVFQDYKIRVWGRKETREEAGKKVLFSQLGYYLFPRKQGSFNYKLCQSLNCHSQM